MMESLQLSLEIIDAIDNVRMASTWQLGLKFKIKTPKMRAKMKALEKTGLVQKSRFSTANNTVWELTEAAKRQGGAE